jgi:hypothetical protein
MAQKRPAARVGKGVSVPDQKSTAEAIIEFRRIGNSVKVSAIDTISNVEVSIIAPASSTERQMTDAVMRKLQYVLSRQKPGP